MQEAQDASARPVEALLVDGIVFGLAFAVSLLGDAAHVSSGLTRYTWVGVPTLWYSAFWFPLVASTGILFVARVGTAVGLPVRARTRGEAFIGIAAVLALYALTAALHTQPAPVSATFTSAAAAVLWGWWDPSIKTFAVACACACLGPLAEVGFAALGAVTYAEGARTLFGVSPMLPGLYFAAGAVASGLRGALAPGAA